MIQRIKIKKYLAIQEHRVVEDAAQLVFWIRGLDVRIITSLLRGLAVQRNDSNVISK